MVSTQTMQTALCVQERVKDEGHVASHGSVQTLFEAATRLYEEGNERQSRGLYQQCLCLAQEQEERAVCAWCLLRLADIARQIGSDNAETPFDRMNTLAEEALPLFRVAGDTRGEAACLLLLSIAYLQRREMAEVDCLIAQSQALSEASGDLAGVAAAMMRRSAGLPRENEDQKSALYARALELYQAAGDRRGMANILILQSRIQRWHNEPHQAFVCCEQALVFYRAIGDKKRTAEVLLSYAHGLQDPQQQVRCYREAAYLSRAVGVAWSEAAALDHLGSLSQVNGDLAAARAYYMQALGVRRAEDSGDGCISSLQAFASLAQAQGEEEKVIRLYAAASALQSKSDWPIPSPQEALNRLRGKLGDERFRVLWTEGTQLTVAEAAYLAVSGGQVGETP